LNIGVAFIAVAVMAASALVTGWVRREAVRRLWLDIPNARSSHRVPTPRGGGLGIVIASGAGFLALWLIGAIGTNLCAALLGGGLAVALIGFRDDRQPVAAGLRLAVHFGAAAWALAWLGGVPPMQFGARLVDLGIIGDVLGAVAIVWTLNLFNFMDGIDGLAASEASFIAFAGAWLAAGAAIGKVPAASVVFGAACIGFLPWNWPPAKIFMGDVGSGYVGYVLALLALVAMWQSPVALFAWLSLGAVFFVDATITLLRRALRGERAHEAHRSHAYQWLARSWGSHGRVTLAAMALNAGLLLPLAWSCLEEPRHAAGWLGIAMMALTAIALLAGAGRAEPSQLSPPGTIRHSKE
jgi:Fuc2NAc and GlcNAc transferase